MIAAKAWLVKRMRWPPAVWRCGKNELSKLFQSKGQDLILSVDWQYLWLVYQPSLWVGIPHSWVWYSRWIVEGMVVTSVMYTYDSRSDTYLLFHQAILIRLAGKANLRSDYLSERVAPDNDIIFLLVSYDFLCGYEYIKGTVPYRTVSTDQYVTPQGRKMSKITGQWYWSDWKSLMLWRRCTSSDIDYRKMGKWHGLTGAWRSQSSQ